MLPRDEWEVLIVDHHPGYITWERYERLQDELRANWQPREALGAGRSVRGRRSCRVGSAAVDADG